MPTSARAALAGQDVLVVERPHPTQPFLPSARRLVRALCSTACADGMHGGPPPGSKYVELPSTCGMGASVALKPSNDGGPLATVGMSDRGVGLVYRMGRLWPDTVMANGSRAVRDGYWLIKVSPPLDNSSDAAGGIGRMVPVTLLVHDQSGEFCTLVREEDTGHGSLLRAALRTKQQTAYLWATDATDESGNRTVRIYTEPVPIEPEPDW